MHVLAYVITLNKIRIDEILLNKLINDLPLHDLFSNLSQNLSFIFILSYFLELACLESDIKVKKKFKTSTLTDCFD
jgi:hypothetical protein